MATPASAIVGNDVAVLGARAPSRISALTSRDGSFAAESVRGGGATGDATAVESARELTPVSGRSDNAAAAESTHCVMPVSVTRAMLS